MMQTAGTEDDALLIVKAEENIIAARGISTEVDGISTVSIAVTSDEERSTRAERFSTQCEAWASPFIFRCRD